MSPTPPYPGQKITARILELRRIHADNQDFQRVLDVLDEVIPVLPKFQTNLTTEAPMHYDLNIFTRIERLLP